MDDNNEMRWIAVMVGVIAIAGAVASGVVGYSKSLTDRAAMEHGYTQIVDEKTKETLWVKAEQQRKDGGE